MASKSMFKNNPKRLGAFSRMFSNDFLKYKPRKPLRLIMKPIFMLSFLPPNLQGFLPAYQTGGYVRPQKDI